MGVLLEEDNDWDFGDARFICGEGTDALVDATGSVLRGLVWWGVAKIHWRRVMGVIFAGARIRDSVVGFRAGQSHSLGPRLRRGTIG